jgi:ankyrin repeat protein
MMKIIKRFSLFVRWSIPSYLSGYKHNSLYAAAWEGHLETVQVLVGCGADVNIPTHTGKTPVWIAAQEGYVDVIKFLHSSAISLT